VLVPADSEWAAALTIPQDDVRVTFAVPMYGMLLLGTTDAPHDGPPGEVAVEPEDVEQILAEASVALDPSLVSRERVRAAFAGLRVLPAAGGASPSARRETVLTVGPGGMLSVAGGKLTTYRRIALAVLLRLRSDLGLHRIEKRPWPLPGAKSAAQPTTGPGLGTNRRSPLTLTVPGTESVKRVRQSEPHGALWLELDPAVRENLAHLYGSLATDVLGLASDDLTLLEPLHPAGPDIAAQAVYAVTDEWARNAEDVIRRRTTLFYRGLAGEHVVRRVEALLDRASALPR
jgi:glycerol-3-phosphate dehydrogenase